MTVWLDRPDAKALRDRADYAGVNLDEYVAGIVHRVAAMGADHVPVVLDVERADYQDLRAFVANLLDQDEDADADQELVLHLGADVAILADHARSRGRI